MNRQRAIVLVLLLILFARLTLDARKVSFTSDEPSHIASGYAYLARGATWTIPLRGHPLLIDAWLALPVYLGNASIPLTALPGWEEDNTRYVHSFVPYLTAHIERAEVASRTPVMLLTVLLAAVVARWAYDVAGRWGSLMALIVLTCDPILLGHGMLATNDIGVTSLGTLGLFLTHRLSRKAMAGGQGLAATTGIALGATLLAKSSGVIWLAGSAAMLTAEALRKSRDLRSLAKRSLLMAEITSVALLCVWAFYGFEVSTLPAFGVQFPLPAATHWTSVLTQSKWADIRDTYFLGTLRVSGDWRYFPIAALIKNPLPMLGLIFLALLTDLRRLCKEAYRSPAILLWIFPLLYSGIAVYSKINIGYRHMIPVHPFLYLLIATLATRCATARAVSAALIVWLIIDSALTAPNYIAYFNQITGGPRGGWRYLGDSNTDWAQGFKALRSFELTQSSAIRFSVTPGYVGPVAYGIHMIPLPPMHQANTPVFEPAFYPPAGTYVIGANSLAGLGCIDHDNYAWFRYHPSDAIIAGALFVYTVPPVTGQAWLAQCTIPAPPLTEEAIASGFASPPVRIVNFDCRQTWIYPGGRRQPGWYALHEQALDTSHRLAQRLLLRFPQPAFAITARHLKGISVGYRQWEYHDLPAFVLYEDLGLRELPLPPEEVVIPAPADTVPQESDPGVNTPVPLQGPLEFLGAVTAAGGEPFEIETWWRVTRDPVGRPFSIMAHLLTANGQVLDVADGLGIAQTELQKGDVLVQSHVFPNAAQSHGLWLRTGAYWLDTGKRWPIVGAEGDAVFVNFKELSIR